MKNIKDITISIFAIIGFVAILSSFNNQSQETHSTVPESHVWDAISDNAVDVYLYNKKTGEARYLFNSPKEDRGYYELIKAN